MPVLDQIFRPLIGQRVARLQDQDLEHQRVIIGRAATLGPVDPRDGTLQFGPERLEIYQRTQPLQIVALGGDLSESLLDVKEPRLPPMTRPRFCLERVNHETVGSRSGLLGGVQLLGQEPDARLRDGPADRRAERIFLDGIVMKRSWAGEVSNVSLLAAIGVNAECFREILGICEGAKEDKSGWAAFLRHLVDRELKGVELIISDACRGLVESVAEYLLDARWQRCVVGLLKKKPVLDSLGLSSGRGGDLNAGAAGAATTRVLCLRLAA
jgi:hypothetical protein